MVALSEEQVDNLVSTYHGRYSLSVFYALIGDLPGFMKVWVIHRYEPARDKISMAKSMYDQGISPVDGYGWRYRLRAIMADINKHSGSR